jgi:hypothetical protein
MSHMLNFRRTRKSPELSGLIAETEKDIQKKIMIHLTYLEIQQKLWYSRINSGTFSRGGRHIAGAKKGTPDIIVALANSIFLGIEIKTKTGKTKDSQIDLEQRYKNLKINYIKVRSFEDFITQLQKYLE